MAEQPGPGAGKAHVSVTPPGGVYEVDEEQPPLPETPATCSISPCSAGSGGARGGRKLLSPADIGGGSASSSASPAPHGNASGGGFFFSRAGSLPGAGPLKVVPELSSSPFGSERSEWHHRVSSNSGSKSNCSSRRASPSSGPCMGPVSSSSSSWMRVSSLRSDTYAQEMQRSVILQEQSRISPFLAPLFRCTAAWHSMRRKVAPSARWTMRSRLFQLVMFVALLFALFLVDIWVIIDQPDNDDLDLILTVVLAAFLFELTLQSFALARSYWGSFFFWMDILGAASLLLDLSYLEIMPSSNGSGRGASGNAVVMRAARIAKLGARAGRFTRLVKFLRFLPGMKEQGTDQGTARLISARLIHALSTRVSCVMILMVMVVPTFGMMTHPAQDGSMRSWLEVLDKASHARPESFHDQLARFSRFYQEMDYYPYKLEFRSVEDAHHSVRSALPWHSLREGPRRSANSVRQQHGNLVCEFNFKSANQMDAAMNLLLLVTVMVLMVGFSLLLSNAVSATVLGPLEKLMFQVRRMASTIFESVCNMACSMRESEEASNNMDEGSYDADGYWVVSSCGTFGSETKLLEKVLGKLAVLSEITMQTSVFKDADMEGLDEGDRAVIHGFQGLISSRAWGSRQYDDDFDDEEEQLMGMDFDEQQEMLQSAGLSKDLINSWNLNPLELDKVRNHASCMYYISPFNHGVVFDTVAMSDFLDAVEMSYSKTQTVPYHNWFHALDVTHCVYRLLHLCATEVYFSSSERFALLLSATGHDIGHPGMNNPFLIETSHELALRYNDKSPLENMHCARLFELVSIPKCNIFRDMPQMQQVEVRKICIEAILHTDNAQHFAMVKDIQMMYEVNSEILDASRGFFVEDPDEFPTQEAMELFRQSEVRKILVRLMLHVADTSNSTKPFRICKIWAAQVLEEFFIQGDAEKALGIPVQALNDREKVNRAFSQVGFIEFFMAPLLFNVMKVLPPVEQYAECMLQNLKIWRHQWLQDTQPPPSEQEKEAVADRITRLEARYQECLELNFIA